MKHKPNTHQYGSNFRYILILALFMILLTACNPAEDEAASTQIQNTEEPATPATQNGTPIPQEIPTELSAISPTQPFQTSSESGIIPPDSVSILPDPENYEWKLVASGFNRPVFLLSARDGTGRIFVVEQVGRVSILQDGERLSEPFLDITARVGSSGSEQGLLGLDFHPDFPQTPSFFVNYTGRDGNTVISRFTVPDGKNVADPSSEQVLLQIPQPYGNHNGGGVAFGPDGYLYLSLGDGGSAGDPQRHAQNLNSYLGKILRIDINQGEPYGIPAANPFLHQDGLAEIWSYGLRNPWRFSFDRFTGDLYIADVGQNRWEEINYMPAQEGAGANYGWDYLEASQPYRNEAPPQGMVFIPPMYEYAHDQGCSVTGGYVYRGENLPDWQGVYIFGDFCSGNIWGSLQQDDGIFETRRLMQTTHQISSFGEDEQGEIYLLSYREGGIYRLEMK